MTNPRAALLPPAIAVAVAVGIQLITQFAQIGHPRRADAGRYVAPDPVPPVERTRGDFEVLLWGGRAFASGHTSFADVAAYVREHDSWKRSFTYPPLVYVALAPVGLLPDPAASWVWLFASALVFPACLALWIRRSFASLGSSRLPVAFLTLLSFALSASALLEMERGNFNWLVAALYIGAMLLLSRGRSVAAGAALAVAIALKAFPAVSLPVLLALRRWKAAAASAGFLALIALATGAMNSVEWVRELGRGRIQWSPVCGWNTSLYNAFASLAGRHNGEWTQLASWVAYGLLAVGFGAAVTIRARRAPAPAPDRVLALALPFMFLVPAATWSYTLFSLTALLPVLSELSASASRKGRLWIAAAAALVGLCQSPLVALVLRGGNRALTPMLSLATAGLALLAPILVLKLGGEVDEASVSEPEPASESAKTAA